MSSEDIQRRLRLGPDEAMQLQAYLDAKAEEAAGDPDCTAGVPEECQEHQEMDRIAAIHRALAHPMFYDGDMGADIRWLLANVAALKNELIGTNEMKAKFEQSAAEGWAKYRELKVEIDGLLSLVEMWQEVDRSEAPTAGRYIALTDRRDTWLARHRAEIRR